MPLLRWGNQKFTLGSGRNRCYSPRFGGRNQATRGPGPAGGQPKDGGRGQRQERRPGRRHVVVAAGEPVLLHADAVRHRRQAPGLAARAHQEPDPDAGAGHRHHCGRHAVHVERPGRLQTGVRRPRESRRQRHDERARRRTRALPHPPGFGPGHGADRPAGQGTHAAGRQGRDRAAAGRPGADGQERPAGRVAVRAGRALPPRPGRRTGAVDPDPGRHRLGTRAPGDRQVLVVRRQRRRQVVRLRRGGGQAGPHAVERTDRRDRQHGQRERRRPGPGARVARRPERQLPVVARGPDRRLRRRRPGRCRRQALPG
eukprot:XP_002536098.2 5E5 antigen [Ricinus communis]